MFIIKWKDKVRLKDGILAWSRIGIASVGMCKLEIDMSIDMSFIGCARGWTEA